MFIEFRAVDGDGGGTANDTEVRVDTTGSGNFTGDPVVVVLNATLSNSDLGTDESGPVDV